MLKPENQKDKARFENLKDQEQDRGKPEQEAIEDAAQEVKDLRRQEGRSKEQETTRR